LPLLFIFGFEIKIFTNFLQIQNLLFIMLPLNFRLESKENVSNLSPLLNIKGKVLGDMEGLKTLNSFALTSKKTTSYGSKVLGFKPDQAKERVGNGPISDRLSCYEQLRPPFYPTALKIT
jgi:hypothetical protein